MDAFAAIAQRYGQPLPESYRRLQAEGHLELPWEQYLVFYDCEWLPPETIATYDFWKVLTMADGGYIPFAISGRHDEWCFRLDWTEGAEPPVVFCEYGGPEGFGYAPDFRGFLYRKALEQLAGDNDLGGDAKFVELQRAVAIVTPHLPAPWAERLQALIGQPQSAWQKDKYGNLFILPKEELDEIVARELAFRRLNEKFVIDKPRPKKA